MCPPSQEAGELAALICGRTHSTTMMITKEAWEELVTYCPAAKQSEVIVQHRSGSPCLVMEEMDDTPLHPFLLPRDCSRGRGLTLSCQEPGTMMRAATSQEAGPTEEGRWSIQRGLPEL